MSDPFAWTKQGPPAQLMQLLNSAGTARFVGGCVRDSLLGHPPGEQGATDIDVATTLTPSSVTEVLQQAGVKVIPTGLSHGTVTAIIDRVPMEVTTLRCDVSTDGRHAEVAFTDDWEEDAARRDFTINALYLDADGRLYDDHHGQSDLKAGRVRFIGAPADRIREDALRILRFLRFTARFGSDLDQEGWAACLAAKEALRGLSKERIWSEVRRTFPAAGAPSVLAAAAPTLLPIIVDTPADPDLFARVHQLVGDGITPALGLAALWPAAKSSDLRAAFKPSNEDLSLWSAIGDGEGLINNWNARLLLYSVGLEASEAAVLLHAAKQSWSEVDLRAKLKELRQTPVPLFLIQGRDLAASGVPPGPEMGALLKKIETAWMEEGFPQDQQRQLELLRRVLEARTGETDARSPGETR